MLPELADANMDIKVHHVFGSAMLSLTCTTAELSDDDMGGNRDRDRDRADGRLTLSPSDTMGYHHFGTHHHFSSHIHHKSSQIVTHCHGCLDSNSSGEQQRWVVLACAMILQ